MNIVFVKHDSDKLFAFSVPKQLVPYLKKGQGVLCETMRGLAYGQTITGVISGEMALDFATANGAYFPLRPIVGFEHEYFAKAPLIRRTVAKEWCERLSNTFRGNE